MNTITRKFGPIDDTVMTIEEFQDQVECGMFIDSDGFGCFARLDEDIILEMDIFPSDINRNPGMWERLSEVFTHVVWFNK